MTTYQQTNNTMHVITKTSQGTTLFQQVLDSDATLDATVSFLMKAPTGTDLETRVENKGHELLFRTSGDLDIKKLVRHANGILVRDPVEKPAKAKE